MTRLGRASRLTTPAASLLGLMLLSIPVAHAQDVLPAIGSVDPGVVSCGETLALVVRGNGFAPGTQVEFGEGVEVAGPVVVARDGSRLDVSVRVAQDATPGPRTVTALVPEDANVGRSLWNVDAPLQLVHETNIEPGGGFMPGLAVYATETPAIVTAGDVRAVPGYGFAAGSQVGPDDAGGGLRTDPMPGGASIQDADQDARWSPGDTLVWDTDGSGTVSVDDIVLSGQAAGAFIQARDPRIGQGLLQASFSPLYLDVDGSGDLTVGDRVYLDDPGGSGVGVGVVSEGDVRFSGTGFGARVVVERAVLENGLSVDCPVAPQGTDLAVTAVGAPDGAKGILDVTISNLGPDPAGPSKVTVTDVTGRVVGAVTIEALAPGEVVDLEVLIEDPTPNPDGDAIVTVTVASADVDLEPTNNVEFFVVPQTSVSGQTGGSVVPVVVLGSAVLGAGGAGAWTTKRVVRTRRRRDLQRRSHRRDPPDQCIPGGWYCRRKDLDVDLGLAEARAVKIEAMGPNEDEPLEVELEDGPVDAFNEALERRRLGADHAGIVGTLDDAAKAIAASIVELIETVEGSVDATIAVAVEGSSATCNFELYRCVRAGPGTRWKKVDEWTAELNDARDEPLAAFEGLVRDQPDLETRLHATLVEALVALVDRLRVGVSKPTQVVIERA